MEPGNAHRRMASVKRIVFVHAPNAFLAETQQYGAMFMPVWAYTLAAYIDLPEEYDLAYNTIKKEGGLWISKPYSQSQGRGIYLVLINFVLIK